MIDLKTPTSFVIAFLMFHNLDMNDAIKLTNISILHNIEVVSYIYLNPTRKEYCRNILHLITTQLEFVIETSFKAVATLDIVFHSLSICDKKNYLIL